MKTEDIIKNNKLIAEFLGWKKKAHNFFESPIQGHYDDNFPNNLHFHESWSWLMSAVEKIETLGYWMEISDTFCTISNNRIGIKYLKSDILMHKESKIEATWFAVVEFIKWYNKHNKK